VLHKPSVCSSNQDSQQTAATARLELGNLSVNVYMLLMVSRFTSRTCSLCQAVSKCCTNPPAAIAQQPAAEQRAATEQFQPHIMQAFASTPIRMCWFSQTDLAACCILHLAVWHAAQTLCMQPQQQPADSRIAATAQPELSDVPMQASVHMPACSCVLVWSSRTCS
jgi:hypothetical protein